MIFLILKHICEIKTPSLPNHISLKVWQNFHLPLCVTCHMSCVTCHMSCVTWQMSHFFLLLSTGPTTYSFNMFAWIPSNNHMLRFLDNQQLLSVTHLLSGCKNYISVMYHTKLILKLWQNEYLFLLILNAKRIFKLHYSYSCGFMLAR